MSVVASAREQPLLSLCMLVKDEELLIEQAIESVRAVVDEIVVVDTGSTDRTREIAARCGAKVYQCELNGCFGRARNETLRLASGRWVIVLDGDETIAARDAARLRDLVRAPTAAAYRLTVHNYTRSLDLLCNWHPNRGAYPEEELRSGCPGSARFPVVRLFRREPHVRYEESYTTHTNPLRALRAAGAVIEDAPIAIHHFQCLKGGEAFVARKQHERLPCEQRHLQQQPDDALAHVNVGRTLFALGRDQEALWHLRRAVALDDTGDRARLSLGIVLFEIAAYADAAAQLETAVHNHPESADAWTVLGMSYHALEQHQAAQGALQRALTLHPLHPVALNSFGVVLMDLAQREQAARYFQRALSVLPGFAAARENLRALADGDQVARVEIGDERDDV